MTLSTTWVAEMLVSGKVLAGALATPYVRTWTVPLCTVLAPLYRHYSQRNATDCEGLQSLSIRRKMLLAKNLFAFRRHGLKRLLTALSKVRVLVGELDVNPAERLT